eukprot:535452_1
MLRFPIRKAFGSVKSRLQKWKAENLKSELNDKIEAIQQDIGWNIFLLNEVDKEILNAVDIYKRKLSGDWNSEDDDKERNANLKAKKAYGEGYVPLPLGMILQNRYNIKITMKHLISDLKKEFELLYNKTTMRHKNSLIDGFARENTQLEVPVDIMQEIEKYLIKQDGPTEEI